ncbi:hypothetical protein RclHR1_02040041 [Rhizophagus clarus]|uniref:Uncharacterized protein n=1 Tax=Rhizophagus clarus TaxID=94130 RepID=A0A2Z6R3U3_9GLOM|nr:hypothetical protein RclHR1_02040041 [Rhizophagus clarus]GES94203.1 hypothetical protein RCL_jg22383.t1 [Rhizophagus clarus]
MDLLRDHDVKDLDKYYIIQSKTKHLVSLSDHLHNQLRSVTYTYQECQLRLINSPDLLDIAECNRNSSTHIKRLLKKKLPKIFDSPYIEHSDEDLGMIISEYSPTMPVSLFLKMRLNKRISSFHDHMPQKKRIKLIPIEPYLTTNNRNRALSSNSSSTLSCPIDTFKNLYLGRSTGSHDDTSSLKCVKSTHDNGD